MKEGGKSFFLQNPYFVHFFTKECKYNCLHQKRMLSKSLFHIPPHDNLAEDLEGIFCRKMGLGVKGCLPTPRHNKTAVERLNNETCEQFRK